MSRRFSKQLVALVCLMSAAATAQAGQPSYARQVSTQTVVAGSGRVIHKFVQRTRQFEVGRAEVATGSTVTLLAPFLLNEQGYVMLHLDGASHSCTVIEWKHEAVTVQLPNLGLNGPKNARLQILMPNGRVAKTFAVLFVPQPDILVHADTIPQPMPPAPGAQPVTYATPTAGGLTLQGGIE